MGLLIQFCYLQLLDILTTIAFLLNGAKEANPIVRSILRLGGQSPLAGLIFVKIFAIVLALYCFRNARLRLLARVNIFFAALVTWNLLVLIVTSPVLDVIVRK